METSVAKDESLVVPRIVIAFWGVIRLCIAAWFTHELLHGFFSDLQFWLAAWIWIVVFYLTVYGIYMLGVAAIWWRLIERKTPIWTGERPE